ncbi:hypothetical protein LQZ19_16615 [Treponema primitia]|uniref:hypothetical protein n=1 Tax=Treponema primitia TaxID=88058 RepID=UPI0039809FDB
MLDYLPFDPTDLGEDVRLYDYQKPGVTDQRFLAHYTLPLGDDSGVDLVDIRAQLKTIEEHTFDVNFQYDIPDVPDDMAHPDADGKYHTAVVENAVDLTDIIGTIEGAGKKTLNRDGIPLQVELEIPLSIPFEMTGFDTVTFKPGMSFKLDFTLSTPGGFPSGLDNVLLIIKSLKLSKSSIILVQSSTSLSLNNSSKTGSVSLTWVGSENKTFPKDPVFECTLKIDHNGSGSSPDLADSNANYNLKIETSFENPENLTGVTNLAVDSSALEVDFGSADPITLVIGGGFISADIGVGNFNLDFGSIFPPKVDSNKEWWQNIAVRPGTVKVHQYASSPTEAGLTLETIEEKHTSLNGQHLTKEPIKINGEPTVTIAGSLSFNNITVRKDAAKYFIDRTIYVDVDIDFFSLVTLNSGPTATGGADIDEKLSRTEIFEVPDDVADLVNYIQFPPGGDKRDILNGIGVYLEVTKIERLDNMEMFVEAADLNINSSQVLESGFISTSHGYIKFTNNTEFPFTPPPPVIPPDPLVVNGVEIHINMVPTSPGGYDKVHSILKLANVEPGKSIEIQAIAKPIFGWKYISAKVPADFKEELMGRYPKAEDDPIDLSSAADYAGLGFKDINAQLYLTGPDSITPALKSFSASFGSKPAMNLYTPGGAVGVIESFPRLSVEAGEYDFDIYNEAQLPGGGNSINLKDVINKVMAGETDPLVFTYEIEMNDNRVTPAKEGVIIEHDFLYPPGTDPADYPKTLSPEIHILVELPLVFEVQDHTKDLRLEIKDLDLGDEDLFSRNNAADESYFEYVTSLELNIDMKNLAGLNKGKFILINQPLGQDQPDEIPLFDLSKQHLQVKPDMAILKRFPFIPKLIIEFPKETTDLQFDRGLSIDVQSITIKAEAGYTLETGF